ncbi:hypothetical protein G6F59_018241 [Rhizopus arrhizus]|nr:hypothetical protein G6F59_018241 [Rhizopus arrhizus]
MTLPFSASASPMASSDSALALSMNPQVLTTTTSASLYSGVTSYPSVRTWGRRRAESTRALGQPSDTKPTRGARPGLASWAAAVMASSVELLPFLAEVPAPLPGRDC